MKVMDGKANPNDLINQFCQVTGSNENVARSFLIASNNILNLAISLYMDNPESIPTVNNEACRSPIPQRNEQLLPVELPRVGIPSLRSCRRAFVTEDSDDSGDELLRCNNECTNGLDNLRNFSQQQSDDNGSVCEPASSNRLVTDVINNSKSNTHKKRKHLQQLFKPPMELMFNGSLDAAQHASQEKLLWLLVSIHDEGCFECHILNRDVWKDPSIYQLIKRHFIFLQLNVDSPEGVRYRSQHAYVQGASHIALLDPFTGEQKMMWTHLNDPKLVYDVISEFLHHSTLSPPLITKNLSQGANPTALGCTSRNETTADYNGRSRVGRRVPNSDCASNHLSPKRRRMMFFNNDRLKDQWLTGVKHPLDLSEEEQLQIAIAASKASVTTTSNSDIKSVIETPLHLSHHGDENTTPSTTTDIPHEPILLTDDEEEEDTVSADVNVYDTEDNVRNNQHRHHHLKNNSSDDDDDSNIEIGEFVGAPLDNDQITEDCILVDTSSDSSSFDHQAKCPVISKNSNVTSSLSSTVVGERLSNKLPIPLSNEVAFEILFRFPDGHREVHRLCPDLKLQDLHSYFESRGFPFSNYEIVRIHTRLHLADLIQTATLFQAGLNSKDTLFLQER